MVTIGRTLISLEQAGRHWLFGHCYQIRMQTIITRIQFLINHKLKIGGNFFALTVNKH